jgi:hypothetical protein
MRLFSYAEAVASRFGRFRSFWCVLAPIFLISGAPTTAQVPSSVDIDLSANTTNDSLIVRVRANDSSFDELLTALTFTIRCSATATGNYGSFTVPCSVAMPFSEQALVTSGSYKYKTYNAFSTALITDICPSRTWPAGQWISIMWVKMNGVPACTEYAIVNDTWTSANNRDFFISLNGLERTGSIDPQPASIGNCQGDCFGVVGGSALPGTACDDGNECTASDTWSASCECSGQFQDDDGDGTCDAFDGCPADPLKVAAGICGCGVSDADGDGDGTVNCLDGCPADPTKTAPGICGCNVPDADSDLDGTVDCNDLCPNDPNKIAPGQCGCGNGEAGSSCDDGNASTINDQVGSNCACVGTVVDCNDTDPCTLDSYTNGQCVHAPLPDADGDGTCDLIDECPGDPNKVVPGPCGCGNADTDTDADGLADCVDTCPFAVGQVGSTCNDGNTQTINDQLLADCTCGGTLVNCDDQDPCTSDVFNGNQCVHTSLPDSDGDGVCDGSDSCPADPLKLSPGFCGCGTPDIDSDGDLVYDCVDGCPSDPLKTTPGACGCGSPDTDTDGDASADCVDNCPNIPGVQGSACNDGNAGTVNDALNAQCVCIGNPLNDACADATSLVVQTPANCPANATAGNNSNSTQEGALPQCVANGPLGDVWYSFNSGVNDHVMIGLDHGSMTSWGFALYNACNGADIVCVSAPTSPVEVTVTAGTAYLVRIFSASGQGGAFSLCVNSSVQTGVVEMVEGVLGAVSFSTDGRLQLEWMGSGTTGHLQLLDIRGRVLDDRRIGLVSGMNGPVMLAGVSPGVYLLRLDADGSTTTRRLMAE